MAYDVAAPVPERLRTRQRILENALALFCAEGYEGSSLRQLADRLELTPAALYYHFESKADILAGVVAPLLDAVDQLLDRLPDGEGAANERTIVEQVVDVLLEHRAIVTMLASDASASRAPAIRDRLVAQNLRLLAAIGGPSPEPERLVRIASALGAVRRPLIDLPDLDLRAHRGTIVASAIAALQAPATHGH